MLCWVHGDQRTKRRILAEPTILERLGVCTDADTIGCGRACDRGVKPAHIDAVLHGGGMWRGVKDARLEDLAVLHGREIAVIRVQGEREDVNRLLRVTIRV